MNTAAMVRKRKEAHPELYCTDPRCLWRTGGGPCPRHKPTEDAPKTTQWIEAGIDLETAASNHLRQIADWGKALRDERRRTEQARELLAHTVGHKCLVAAGQIENGGKCSFLPNEPCWEHKRRAFLATAEPDGPCAAIPVPTPAPAKAPTP